MFIVIEGEYSDWEILGYFENRDGADRYCLGTDYYVEEVGKLSLNVIQQSIKIHREYQVTVYHDDGRVICNDWNYDLYAGNKRGVCFKNKWRGYDFKITAKSPGQAKKIACDYMAKIKAEKAGI